MTKILFALPAYNEEKSLPSLLKRIDFIFREFEMDGQILVVNDGSTDTTSEVAHNFKTSFPVRVVDVQPNQGLANAMRVGIHTAVDMLAPEDIVIFMDADDSHPPGLARRMIHLIHEGADIVIASRYQPGARIVGLSNFRIFLSWGASLMFRTRIGIPGVKDYTCGFRAYRVALLKKGLEHYGDKFIQEKGFACMAEILIKLAKFKPVVVEVPMILRYDQKESDSKMRIWRTVKQTVKMLSK